LPLYQFDVLSGICFGAGEEIDKAGVSKGEAVSHRRIELAVSTVVLG
jgi:hypothetical protein